MVKIKSSVGIFSGKIGNMRFYEVNGQNIGAIIPEANNPKTEAQMKQRVKINNILGMYKYVKACLQQNFEGVSGNKNASIFFRSYNLMKTPVWLTKAQKLYNRYVLAPYVVSQGRITPINYTYTNGTFVSDIEIADLDISNDTDISELTSYIHKYNEGWAYEDTLQVILLSQDVIYSEEEKLPYPKCSAFTITLYRNSFKPIANIPDHETPTSMPRLPLCNIDGKLGIRLPQDTLNTQAYAFALVHGRGEGHERMVYTQQLSLSNTSLYDYYTGTEALDKALDSYKTKREKPFLKPE